MEDIVFITIAAVVSGSETWYDIEEFAILRQQWLEEILELPHGIPSHDTFNRFFSCLDPSEFEEAFSSWTDSICKRVRGDFIGIDGKTMRGTRGTNLTAAHIVSAWSDSNSLVLGQLKVDKKSNEIKAIPQLLDKLMLTGNTVTIDAMGCQREIAEQIITKEADYVLALKENQKRLFEETLESFAYLKPTGIDVSVDSGHGRVETRKCYIINDLSMLLSHEDKSWAGLKSIVKIESEHFIKSTGEIQSQSRYYISSLEEAEKINQAVRRHWGIENKLHWVLDVVFNEDKQRSRTMFAAQNQAIINKVALNLIQKNKTAGSIRLNRKAAG